MVRPRRDREGFVIVLLGASASQEMCCPSRAFAITFVTRTARSLQASVWETVDGVTFELIATHSS